MPVAEWRAATSPVAIIPTLHRVIRARSVSRSGAVIWPRHSIGEKRQDVLGDHEQDNIHGGDTGEESQIEEEERGGEHPLQKKMIEVSFFGQTQRGHRNWPSRQSKSG